MLTDKEYKLLYRGIGSYKGWRCIEIGGGGVIMKQGSQTLRAFTVDEEDWVEECWNELKAEIDRIERV